MMRSTIAGLSLVSHGGSEPSACRSAASIVTCIIMALVKMWWMV